VDQTGIDKETSTSLGSFLTLKGMQDNGLSMRYRRVSEESLVISWGKVVNLLSWKKRLVRAERWPISGGRLVSEFSSRERFESEESRPT